MTDWATDWLTVQFGSWPVDRIDRLSNWLTDCALGYLTGWQDDWLSNWLTGCAVGHLAGWQNDWLSNWLTDWLTVQLGTWLADRMTDWAADWLCSWVPDWLTEWLIEQLTEWLTKLSNLPSDWLTDLGTDWGLQSRGQLNKTFTSVIYKCIHCLESVLITLWTNKLLYSIPMNFNFLFSRTAVSDNSN